MPGAAEYELLVYNMLNNQKTKNNKYLNKNGTIEQGKALSRMSAQSVAHLLMIIFIILGNVSYYFSRKIIK